MAVGGATSRFRIIRFGPFELDVRAAELCKQGIKVRLHEQPFRILLMLLRAWKWPMIGDFASVLVGNDVCCGT
jgi:hypothetical protein